MKHFIRMLALLLSLFLLSACTTQGQSYCPPAEESDLTSNASPGHTVVFEPPTTTNEITCVGTPEIMTCRIESSDLKGNLLLTGLEDKGCYTLAAQGLEIYSGREKLDHTALKDGMVVSISYRAILETYPARFHQVTLVDILKNSDH